MSEPTQDHEVIDHVPVKKEAPKTTVAIGQKGIELRSMDDLIRFGQFAVQAGMVPDSFNKCKNPAAAAVVAIQSGLEVGLTPMQALAYICVVNGRPCLWGEAPKSLVMSSGTVEDWEETWDEATKTATCTVKRKGIPTPIKRQFSMADAAKAGLDKKAGPWQQYPFRMCSNRARTWVIRDGFADCLLGLHVAEEVQDYDTQPQERRIVSAENDPLLSGLSA